MSGDRGKTTTVFITTYCWTKTVFIVGNLLLRLMYNILENNIQLKYDAWYTFTGFSYVWDNK